MNASEAPAAATDRELLCRLWEREVLLEGSALLVHFDDALPASAEATRSAVAFFERLPGLVILSSGDPVRSALRRSVRCDVPPLTLDEQRAEWQAALGHAAPELLTQPALASQLERLVTHFSLGQQAIHTITEEALAQLPDPDTDPDADPDTDPDADPDGDTGRAGAAAELGRALWEASRIQARPHLDDLAQRIQSRAGWNDLILPKAQLKILRAIVEAAAKYCPTRAIRLGSANS